MKLTPYDKKKLVSNAGYKVTDIHALLDEFADGDLDCVKIEGWTHKNATSCYSSFSGAIKRHHMTGIRCFVVNNEVFLVKETKN